MSCQNKSIKMIMYIFSRYVSEFTNKLIKLERYTSNDRYVLCNQIIKSTNITYSFFHATTIVICAYIIPIMLFTRCARTSNNNDKQNKIIFFKTKLNVKNKNRVQQQPHGYDRITTTKK